MSWLRFGLLPKKAARHRWHASSSPLSQAWPSGGAAGALHNTCAVMGSCCDAAPGAEGEAGTSKHECSIYTSQIISLATIHVAVLPAQDVHAGAANSGWRRLLAGPHFLQAAAQCSSSPAPPSTGVHDTTGVHAVVRSDVWMQGLATCLDAGPAQRTHADGDGRLLSQQPLRTSHQQSSSPCHLHLDLLRARPFYGNGLADSPT